MSKLARAIKKLGDEFIQELEAKSPGELETHIINAEKAMSQAQDELEANPKYQELKDSLAAVTEGKKEVDKRQKAIIAVSLHLLAQKGSN